MTPQKTILHLARLYAPYLGGVETHVSAVSQELLQQGYQVKVITTQHQSNLPLNETIDGVEVWRMPGSDSSKRRVWTWIWQHRQLLSKADIIQVHDVFWWLWPVYLLVKAKVFITFHGWEGQYPVRWSAKLQRFMASNLSRGRVHVGAWIQEFYWDRPDAVIYGGIKNAHRKPVFGSSLKQIVFFGRLTHENEVEKSIQLFQYLKRTSPQLKITWIGDGPLAKKCRNLGTVTGMVAHPTSLLASADLVVASSYLSILEAQAQGKIVVSLYSHSLKQRYLETYPGAQYLVMSNDPLQAATQIEKIWKNSSQRRTQANGAFTLASQLTWKKIVKVYQKLWH